MEEPEFNEEDRLTEVERMEIERLMLSAAYENSYRVLTNKVEFEDLLEEKSDLGVSALMAYDPLKGVQKEELENIITFYIDLDETEYYLRCAELKKIMHEIYPETLN